MVWEYVRSFLYGYFIVLLWFGIILEWLLMVVGASTRAWRLAHGGASALRPAPGARRLAPGARRSAHRPAPGASARRWRNPENFKRPLRMDPTAFLENQQNIQSINKNKQAMRVTRQYMENHNKQFGAHTNT